MTEKEFKSLKVGDLIRNKYNIYYIIEVRDNCFIIRSSTSNNCGIASEPSPWTKIKNNKVIILGGQNEKGT